MAIDKKMLQRFLDNPARVGSQEFNEETPDMKEAQALDPEEMLESPEEESEESPEEEMQEVASKQPTMVDEDILSKLKKLKAGEPIESQDDQEIASEVASDIEAPTDLRKKAIMRIKQKYLGQ